MMTLDKKPQLSDKKTHVTEVVAGLLAVLSVGAGIVAWWLGLPPGHSAGVAVGFLVPTIMLALVAKALRTRRMGGKGGTIFRDRAPLKFWGLVIAYVLFGLVWFCAVMMMILLSV